MMKSVFFLRFFISTMLMLCVSLVSAENTVRSQNKLKSQISSVKSDLKSSLSTSKNLKRKVIVAEDKLNSISKDLHATKSKINKLTSKLMKSNARKKVLLVNTNKQKDALAQQMQALYTSGKQSHLRLLLKQDDPSDISRTIKYFEYLNKHRIKRINAIKVSLEKVDTLQTRISKDSTELKVLQKKQSRKKKSLKKAVSDKEVALKKQRKVVSSQKQKLANLVKQESRLQGVIQNLAKKRLREEMERERAKQKEKEKQKLATKKKKSTSKKDKKKTLVAEPHYVPNKSFSSLKGKLSWPVRGKLTRRYGSNRNSKQAWKGVMISASAGSNVYAVARGKVEFSGRLKGYGYLVIIRHDKNYRSLYAYNRSVYKKKGQIVKGGDIIAAVGNTGGRETPGLYFEIRRGTSHQNPAKWCR